MNIFKFLGYSLLAGLLVKVFFTSSIAQVSIVILIFSSGIYFIIRKQLFWKLYAYVFAILAVLVSVGFLFEEYDLRDYIWIPITVLISISIYGLAYKKAIFNRLFWILVLFVNGLDLILFNEEVSSLFSEVEDLGLVWGTIYLLFVCSLIMPMYIALFKYSFYSEEIWQDSNSNEEVLANKGYL